MTTLLDIASKVGLSKSTVSHVLNGREGFSPQTRERVIQAAKDLNYRPNQLGRSLRQGKSMAIGVIGKGLSQIIANSHVNYFSVAAQKQGYITYPVNITQRGDDSAEVARIAQELIARQVDGILVYRNMPVDVETRRFLESLDIPVVFMGDWIAAKSGRQIVLDFESGMEQVAKHLKSLGHRQVGYCYARGLEDFPEHKLWPYMRCFSSLGIELMVDKRWTIDGSAPSVARSAYEAVSRLLTEGPPVTALLMSNDVAATGAIAAVQSAGLKVPEDISIVGFDNLPTSEFANPPLTTVSGPAPQIIGQAAFDMLHTLITNPKAKVERQIFPFELIQRQSTAPAKGSAPSVIPAQAGIHSSDRTGVSGAGVPPAILPIPQQEKSVARINESQSRRAGASDTKVDAFDDSLIHPTSNLSNPSEAPAPDPQTASPRRPLQFTHTNAPTGDSS